MRRTYDTVFLLSRLQLQFFLDGSLAAEFIPDKLPGLAGLINVPPTRSRKGVCEERKRDLPRFFRKLGVVLMKYIDDERTFICPMRYLQKE